MEYCDYLLAVLQDSPESTRVLGVVMMILKRLPLHPEEIE